jgi:hypothetical protein
MPPHRSTLISLGSLSQSQNEVFRQSYRVLMIVFVLIVITALLPLNLGSAVWGHQLSSTVLNVCLLPWLAIALGRLGVIGQQREQLQARVDATEARQSAVLAPALEGDNPALVRQPGRSGLAKDGGLRFLAKIGCYALILLAIWQAVLFGSSLRQIDASQLGQTQAIDQRFAALEVRLRELPPANLAQALQQLGLAGGPQGEKGTQAQDPFAALEANQARLKVEANQQVNQARFALTRESLRNFLLAVVYSAGFWGLARL